MRSVGRSPALGSLRAEPSTPTRRLPPEVRQAHIRRHRRRHRRPQQARRQI